MTRYLNSLFKFNWPNPVNTSAQTCLIGLEPPPVLFSSQVFWQFGLQDVRSHRRFQGQVSRLQPWSLDTFYSIPSLLILKKNESPSPPDCYHINNLRSVCSSSKRIFTSKRCNCLGLLSESMRPLCVCHRLTNRLPAPDETPSPHSSHSCN